MNGEEVKTQTAVAEGPALEIEHIDDTPAEDRGKGEPVTPPAQLEGSEEEDGQYGEKVQKRIKQLRYLSQHERREREKAENERQAAVEYAKNIISENERLKAQLTTGERVLIDQAHKRAEAVLDTARERYLKAHDSGEPTEILKAQEALSRAVAEHERIGLYQPRREQTQAAQQQQQQYQQPAPVVQMPQQQQAPAEIDDSTKGWLRQNPWFGAPGYEGITGYALGLHQDLVSRRILPDDPATSEEYWNVINSSLKQRFPEQVGSGSGAAHQDVSGQTQNGRQGIRPRPVAPAAGTRTSGTPSQPVKVRLTPSQVQLCKRLGITEETYAREWLKTQSPA